MSNSTLRGPVLAGTDLTTAAEEALRQGARLARDLGERLVVCHVMPEMLRASVLFPQWRGALDAADTQTMAHNARAAVQRELRAMLGAEADAAEIAVESGTPHVGLLAQAEAKGAGVIVVGPGEVADQVVRHSAVPVLVARPSPRGVVVGATDFSDPSLPALAAAAAEARRRGARLHLIHALDLNVFALGTPAAAMPYLEGASAIALEGLGELRGLADTRLQAALRQFDVAGQTRLVEGRAATAIVSYAEDAHAELVVVGTHGRSGFARLTLGSTAAAVIAAAPCSVLVVRLQGTPAPAAHPD